MGELAPATTEELAEVVAQAAANGRKLELRGGGSKAGVGCRREATVVDLRGFSGVVDYDPPELVLTVRAATPLAEVEALLAGAAQMLAFEPFDHGPIFGRPAGDATIGGIVAAGVAGSRRLSAGGVRDHLLGFTAVSGRGEPFVAGAKVVKNVTGYDLPKLMAGSWGRLAALTEVTLKVLPAPRTTATVAVRGLAIGPACRMMARALGSTASVAAAGHLPADRDRRSITALRLEGFAASVAARSTLLEKLLAEWGAVESLDPEEALAIWSAMRSLPEIAGGLPLWRVSIPAKACPQLIAAVAPERWLADWGGGLVWLASDSAAVRTTAVALGGHAMLVRDDQARLADVPVFQPQPPVLAALEERVRRAFDPAGVFETSR